MTITLTLCAALLAASPPTGQAQAQGQAGQAGQKVKMLVTNLTPAGGLSPEVAAAIGDAITAEIARRGFFEPLSAREVETITGQERRRQLIGCSEESSSCLSELAGAMGARFVLSGTVAKLGTAFQLTLQTLDTARAQPVGRATRIAKTLEELRASLPYDVAEATATPMPAPPSRLMQYSLMTGGGVAFLGGALATFDSLTREATINRELQDGTVLRTLAYYREQTGQLSVERGVGVALMVAGAGLAVAGVLLLPAATVGETHAMLVPTHRGVALVGVFP